MERRDSQTSLSWSDDIETVLEKIQNNCTTLSEYHRTRYNSLFDCIKWFKIPIILLSSVNSVFGVMLTNFTSQTVVSVFTSIVSLIVGIIGSLELFLGVNNKMNHEISSQKDTYNLAINISKMLLLSRINRHQDGRQYLEESFNEYQKIITESNIKNTRMNDNLLQIHSPDIIIDIPTRAHEREGCI